MAIKIIDDTNLQDIAEAIQSKDNGLKMTVEQMADRIEALSPEVLVAMGIDNDGWFMSNNPNDDEKLILSEDVDGIYLMKEVV